MKYKLREAEEDEPKTGSDAEDTSPGSGGSFEKVDYNIMLVPDDASLSDVLSAFENIDNYGIYLSNMRGSNVKLKDAMIAHFGPSIPTQKINALKKRGGEPFPPKTKQAVDKFIKDFTAGTTGKPNLLSYEVGPGGSLVFPFNKNPSKEVTKKIIKTVMDKAGISYELKDIEALGENISSKISNIIKETLKQPLKENNETIVVPELAFKIYKVLSDKYPDIKREFTASAFFTFLNDNIK